MPIFMSPLTQYLNRKRIKRVFVCPDWSYNPSLTGSRIVGQYFLHLVRQNDYTFQKLKFIEIIGKVRLIRLRRQCVFVYRSTRK